MMSMPKKAISLDQFKRFQGFIREKCGFFYEEDRRNVLRDQIHERMVEVNINDYTEYFNFIKFNIKGKDEFQKFLEIITVGETYFYRNKPHFEAFEKNVLPELVKKKQFDSRKTFRLWSAGCSRGAEAHSLAIVIRENLPDFFNWEISILGTDINTQFINQAKRGIYSRRDVRYVPEEYLKKYFEREGNEFYLSDEIKKMVKFDYHNLVTENYCWAEMRRVDVIFCRNVTIYFDAETNKKVNNKFYDCFGPYDFLFLGHAETLWNVSNKFESVEYPGTFIYKKIKYPEEHMKDQIPNISIPDINFAEISAVSKKEEKYKSFHLYRPSSVKSEEKWQEKEDLSSVNKTIFFTEDSNHKDLLGKKDDLSNLLEDKFTSEDPAVLYHEAIKYFKKNDFHQAGYLLDEVLLYDPHNAKVYLMKADILAYKERYEDAILELEKILKFDNLYVEAYYLLGVLFCKIEDFKFAEVKFRKALYIDPYLCLAYFNLTNIYIYNKTYHKAKKELHNLIKILERRSKDEIVELSGDLSVGLLLRVCHNTLSTLK